jgi:CDP-diacylglycerol--glycerol-3-phosphate 3-phosphatidyltransferase
VLRVAVGAQDGVVISASNFGKVKTAFQVAMVMCLIAVSRHHPVWVDVLVYVTVVVTVASGVDYFFNGFSRQAARRIAAALKG